MIRKKKNLYSSHKLVAVSIIAFASWFGVAGATGTQIQFDNTANGSADRIEMAQMKQNEKSGKPQKRAGPVKKTSACETTTKRSDKRGSPNANTNGRQPSCAPRSR